MSRTINTLRSHAENGDTIYAFHEVIGDQRCNHSARLDWADLIRRLGPEFDLPARHAYFLSLLRCSVCAREPPRNPKGKMSIIVTPPTSPVKRSTQPIGLEAGARRDAN